MTDERPAPQYGEYATPEQQAAAMGKQYVAPIPPPLPATRVNLAAPAPAPAAAEERLRIPGNAIDRFASIFQLGVGLVLLLNSDWFNFSENFNTAASQFSWAGRMPLAVDKLGWLILAANILLLLATMAWAYLRLRRGKLAFFIPIIGYAAFAVILSILVYTLA